MELVSCPHRLPIILLGFLLCLSQDVASSLSLRKRAIHALAETLPELRAMGQRSEVLTPSDGNQLRAEVVKAEDFVQHNIPSYDQRTSFKSYLGQNTDNWYYKADLWQHFHYWQKIKGEGDLSETPLLLTQRKMSQWGHVMLAEFTKNMIAENDYRVELFYNWLKARFPSEVATFAPRNFYNLQDMLWNFVIWARENSHLFPENSYQAKSIVNDLPNGSVVKNLLQWAGYASQTYSEFLELTVTFFIHLNTPIKRHHYPENLTRQKKLYEYHGAGIPNSSNEASEAVIAYPASDVTYLYGKIIRGPSSGYFAGVVERVEPSKRVRFIEYMDRKAKKLDYSWNPGSMNIHDIDTLYDRWYEKNRLKNGDFIDRIHYHVMRWWRKLAKMLGFRN